jgi:RNase P subunit RPR2
MLPMFEPGEWYLVVTCDSCKSMLKLFRDLSNGTSKLSGNYILTCPECQHEGAYNIDRVERYQHLEAATLAESA